MRGLLAEVDSREITEWMAYERVEPFGPWREDVRAGVIASTIANVHRSKGQRPFEPADFVPEYGRERAKPDEQAQMQAMMAQMGLIAAAQNAIAGAEDASGQAAQAGDDPAEGGDPGRLRGAGGELEHGSNGVGGVDAAADGDA